MRLQNYINEEKENIDVIWEKLTKDCKPFLKELKKSMSSGYIGNLFYRGYDKFNVGAHGIQKKKARKNRRPVDTPPEIHEILDNEFDKKFGWYVRSEGIFTSSSYAYANSYGVGAFFFPIGKYKYVWSHKIKDLYEHLGGDFLSYVENALIDEPSIGYEDEYEYEYGEDEKGHWEYDGEKIDIDNDIEEELGDDFDDGLLEWIPEIEYDDFLEQRNREIVDNFNYAVRKAIETFKNNDMKSALQSGNEVVFGCENYYLVDYKHKHLEKLVTLIKG